jgi:hypothetical protein
MPARGLQAKQVAAALEPKAKPVDHIHNAHRKVRRLDPPPGWEQRQPWLDSGASSRSVRCFCVINGTTRGRHWSSAAERAAPRRTAAAAGVRRRFARHQFRHAHAVEMAAKAYR